MVSWWRLYFGFNYISDLNSIVSDQNNKYYDCMKGIKVEQNDLDRMHTAENDISIEQTESMNLKTI